VYPNGVYTFRATFTASSDAAPGSYGFSLQGDNFSIGLPSISFFGVTVEA
jgi:hypothetical protein